MPRPFIDMTVFENVLVAAPAGRRPAPQGQLRGRRARRLSAPGSPARRTCPAARLGLLQRKRLEIARALATGPTLLLLDEVAGGLTDPEVTVLVEIVRGINAEGIAVIWIEHVVRALTSLVDRMTCLYGGEFIGDGTRPGAREPPGARDLPGQ